MSQPLVPQKEEKPQSGFRAALGIAGFVVGVIAILVILKLFLG